MRGDLKWGTTPRLVQSAAERFGDREAVVDDDVSMSFADLADAGRRAARAFIATGVEAGDRAAIWAPNCWEWLVALVGLHSAGAVLVPLNTRFKGAEAAYILAKSRARLLLTVTGFLDTDYVDLLAAEREGLTDLEGIVALRGDAPAGTVGWDQFLAAGDAVEEDDAVRRAENVGPDDLSDILFTSGTTGNPKGAMCTH